MFMYEEIYEAELAVHIVSLIGKVRNVAVETVLRYGKGRECCLVCHVTYRYTVLLWAADVR